MKRLDRNDAERINQTWNAVSRDGASGAESAGSDTDELSRAIAVLHGRDDAPHVEPAFADHLLTGLIAQHPAKAADTNQRIFHGRSSTMHQALPNASTRRPARRTRAPGTGVPCRSGLIDLVAVAAVVLLIFTTLIGDRASSLFTQSGTEPGFRLAASSPTAGSGDGAPGTTMHRGDAARTGVMPGPGPTGVPTLAWKKRAKGWFGEVLVSASNRVFTSTFSNQTETFDLIAFDLATGEELWTAPISLGSGSVPTVVDDMVYVNTAAGLQALDASTGDIAWTSAVTAPDTTISPAAQDGVVYNVTLGGANVAPGNSMTALDASDGTRLWSVPLPGSDPGESNFGSLTHIAVAGELVFGRSANGIVSAFDRRKGTLVWSASLEGSAGETFLVSEGVVAVTAVERDQPEGPYPVRLHALDAASGEPLWEPVELTSSSTLAAADGALFVADSLETTGTLSAYDIRTGESLWTLEMGGALRRPVYVDGQLYVLSSGDGTVRRVDAATGVANWSVYLGARGNPVVVDGLLIAAGNEFLYAVTGQETPNASVAVEAPVDLSGLPACHPPRTPPTAPLTGEPAATIDVESRPLDDSAASGPPTTVDGRPLTFADWRYILAANVLGGAPATSAQADRVEATIAAMTACSQRPESESQLAGFFSDDFFRRGIADAQDAKILNLGVQPDEEQLKFLDVFVLEDGRLAASAVTASDVGTFLVFVEEDGSLLIDEVYLVTPVYPVSA